MKHACLFSFALASTAIGQGATPPDVMQGPLSSAAVAMGLGGGVGQGEVLMRAPGAQGAVPQAFSPTDQTAVQDVRLSTMFPEVSGQTSMASLIELDALSINTPIPPVSIDGRIEVHSLWAGIYLTVNNDAVGDPNSLIAQRRAGSFGARDTAGGDILSYYVDGGNHFYPAIVETPVVEMLAEQIDLSNDEQVQFLDLPLGILGFAQEVEDNIVLRNNGWTYFSITAQSAIDLNNSVFGGLARDSSGARIPADAAAVYAMQWLDDISEWKTDFGAPAPNVYIHKTADELGLTSGVHDIDALAVHRGRDLVVFSTVNGPSNTLPQVQVYFGSLMAGSNAPMPSLKNANGVPVEDEVGVNPTADDDVTAACVIDPEIIANSKFISLPRQRPIQAATQGRAYCGISATTSRTPGADYVDVTVQGTGVTPQTPVYLYMTTSYDYEMPAAGPLLNSNAWRQLPLQVLVGSTNTTVHTTFSIPDSISALGIFDNQTLMLRNQRGGLPTYSWAAQIDL